MILGGYFIAERAILFLVLLKALSCRFTYRAVGIRRSLVDAVYMPYQKKTMIAVAIVPVTQSINIFELRVSAAAYQVSFD